MTSECVVRSRNLVILIRSRFGCRTQNLQHRLRAALPRPAANVGICICNSHPLGEHRRHKGIHGHTIRLRERLDSPPDGIGNGNAHGAHGVGRIDLFSDNSEGAFVKKRPGIPSHHGHPAYGLSRRAQPSTRYNRRQVLPIACRRFRTSSSHLSIGGRMAESTGMLSNTAIWFPK